MFAKTEEALRLERSFTAHTESVVARHFYTVGARIATLQSDETMRVTQRAKNSCVTRTESAQARS